MKQNKRKFRLEATCEYNKKYYIGGPKLPAHSRSLMEGEASRMLMENSKYKSCVVKEIGGV